MPKSRGVRVLTLGLVVVLALPYDLLAQDWEARGVAAEQDGRLGEALDAYQSALKASPQSADDFSLRERIVRLTMRMTRPPAIPPESERYAVRATTALKSGDDAQTLASAEADLRRAVRAAPWYAAALYNLALVQANLERYDAAIANFNIYLLMNPSDAEAVRNKITELEYRRERLQQPLVVGPENPPIPASPPLSYVPTTNGGGSVGGWVLLGAGAAVAIGGTAILSRCVEENCSDKAYIVSGIMLGSGLGMMLGSLSLSVSAGPGGVAIHGRLPFGKR